MTALKTGRGGASSRCLALMFLITSGLVAGCEGPSMPSLVKGEPTCKDSKQAGQTIKGSLKKPVRLRILKGEDAVATVMLYGIPESESHPTRFLLPDSNETYTLEWAQCKSERAPTSFDPRDKTAQHQQSTGNNFECKDVDVYQKGEHATKKGDASSHEIPFVEPPTPDCW
ncbi:MAG: hypothetical protein HOW73_01045 [Polyangiaceae bacterium]|nr:hypothetical protein [Polyangiaceae bacterium]